MTTANIIHLLGGLGFFLFGMSLLGDGLKRVAGSKNGKKSKNHHIERVQLGNCTLELGFIFNDCLRNMERVANHCSNLAVAVLESNLSAVHSHDYLCTIKESGDNQYQILLAGYTAKYHID